MYYFARSTAVEARRSTPGELIFGSITAPPDSWIVSIDGVAVAVFTDDEFKKRYIQIEPARQWAAWASADGKSHTIPARVIE